MQDDIAMTSSSTPPPRPSLPARAGDLHFEYTPASPTSTQEMVGASSEVEAYAMNEGGVNVEGANRAPSPGGYTGSRTIHVVSEEWLDSHLPHPRPPVCLKQ